MLHFATRYALRCLSYILTYRSQNDMTRSTFEIVFTRYKDHKRRMSQNNTIQAVDFNEAVNAANLMLTAMKTVDHLAEFAVVSIRAVGYSKSPVGDIGFALSSELVAEQSKAGA